MEWRMEVDLPILEDMWECRPTSPHSSGEDWCIPSSQAEPQSRKDRPRLRRREWNRNAAARYRQKQKATMEVLLHEEQNLRKRRSELADKCSALQREIRHLKGVMRDRLLKT